MLAGETPSQSARHRYLDIENLSAAIAIEVMVVIQVRVIAGGSSRTRHFFDFALRNEHLEVAVDSSERKR